jgi:ribosome-associated protein
MTAWPDSNLDLFVRTALAKKAESIVILDVREKTAIADVFIICSGRSSRQVEAIAEHMVLEMKQHGYRPLSSEGVKEGRWALIDYGHILVHVFHEPVRAFYDLDGLWVDAPRISTPSLAEQAVRPPEVEEYVE